MRFRTPGHQWYCFAAPAILIVLACRQLYLVHSHNLTPWKGGGFGMFATLDRNENRLLRCYLVTDQGEIPVQVPRSDKRLVDQIRSMPTHKLLSKLATTMARATWVSDHELIEQPAHELSQGPVLDFAPGDFAPASSPSLDRGLPRGAEAKNGEFPLRRLRTPSGTSPALETRYTADFSSIRVEVWRIRFNSENHQLTAQKLAEVTKGRAWF